MAAIRAARGFTGGRGDREVRGCYTVTTDSSRKGRLGAAHLRRPRTRPGSRPPPQGHVTLTYNDIPAEGASSRRAARRSRRHRRAVVGNMVSFLPKKGFLGPSSTSARSTAPRARSSTRVMTAAGAPAVMQPRHRPPSRRSASEDHSAAACPSGRTRQARIMERSPPLAQSPGRTLAEIPSPSAGSRSEGADEGVYEKLRVLGARLEPASVASAKKRNVEVCVSAVGLHDHDVLHRRYREELRRRDRSPMPTLPVLQMERRDAEPRAQYWPPSAVRGGLISAPRRST